jgi:hypothetical protein
MEHKMENSENEGLLNYSSEDELKRMIELLFIKLDKKIDLFFRKHCDDIDARNATIVVVNALARLMDEHGIVISTDNELNTDIKSYVEFSRDTMEILSKIFMYRINYLKKEKDLH